MASDQVKSLGKNGNIVIALGIQFLFDVSAVRGSRVLRYMKFIGDVR